MYYTFFVLKLNTNIPNKVQITTCNILCTYIDKCNIKRESLQKYPILNVFLVNKYACYYIMQMTIHVHYNTFMPVFNTN